MKPTDLKTKIFLDGGDPQETKDLIVKLGWLDGQTTNPTLIAKNPEAQKKLASGLKFSTNEILNFYHQVVESISDVVPKGSVSVEVYADKNTTAREMLEQGKKMYTWIPNAHIKLPITGAGLETAEEMIKEGMRVNMTLCFSQEQAGAVYTVTQGALPGQVFLSPFVGRLDDIGEKGMSLIENILRLYKDSDHHVEVLTASVRSKEHFLRALQVGSDIITAPYKLLSDWAEGGQVFPADDFVYQPNGLKPIDYKELDLSKPWQSFDISHPLTTKGLERFASDWNSLIA